MVVALDFESCLIQAGYCAPPPVCLALADDNGTELVPSEDGWRHMRRAIRWVLRQPLIVGFNVAFDFGLVLQWFPELIDEVFRAYDEGRVHDLKIVERLGEIATGRPDHYHNLQTCAALYGIRVEKDDTPRLYYAPLLGEPLSKYTREERDYPRRDADVTKRTYERARHRYARVVSDRAIAEETRYDLWLHLCSAWGVRTSPENVEELRQNAIEALGRLREVVRDAGFIRANGSADVKLIQRAVFDAWDGKPPITKTGQKLMKREKRALTAKERLKYTARNKVACLDSGDPLLEEFGHYGEWSAVMNKDMLVLERGQYEPIHTRYGIAGTTRTTSANPNMQNWRRLEGVRECFTARDGKCFVESDAKGLELATLAQVISWKLNIDHMCRLLNDGIDLHLFAAARLNGWDYEQAKVWLKERDRHGEPTKRALHVKEQRQFCKIANFGYPGFMGAATLVPYARQQGTRITLEQAEDLKDNWGRTLPSCLAYLRHVKTLRNPRTGLYDLEIPGSDIWRAGVTISSAANCGFQGLGARVMKKVGWNLTREAWTDPDSALYALPLVMFTHDSFAWEASIGDQHEVAERTEEVIRDTAAGMMPHVKLEAESVAMLHYSKVDGKRDKRGRLLISDQKEAA